MDKVTIQLADVHARVREAINEADHPDPAAIADRLCDELGDEELTLALREGLRLIVERAARARRREALDHARREAQMAAWREAERRERDTAVDQLAEVTRRHHDLVAERFFAVWKQTPTGRKFLGECTPADLRYSGARNRDQSDYCLRAAEQDERLAAAMEQAGAATVRDLGYEAAARALTTTT